VKIGRSGMRIIDLHPLGAGGLDHDANGDAPDARQ